eukprot:GHVU01204853.1.p1 GENE.GHVU01204853.1~~GHVU01204853.1.p1  ORF type:complete len:763 (+),score=81.87 GHVU01204853.1:70-2358(+)
MDQRLILYLGCLLLGVHLSHEAQVVNVEERLGMWKMRRMVESLNKRSARVERETTPDEILGLGKDEELAEVDRMVTKEGQVEVKLQERYKGLPVLGETVVLKQDWVGEYSEVYGRLVANLEEDLASTKPQLSKQDAFDIAVNDSGDDPSDAQFDVDKNVILEILVERDNRQGKAHGLLVYKLSYLIEKPGYQIRPFYIIDANNGAVINKWDGLSSWRRFAHKQRKAAQYTLVEGVGGNKKAGEYHYKGDGKFPELRVKKGPDGTCLLENEDVRVINYNSTNDRMINETHKFDCDEGNKDGINHGYSPLNDVYYFSNVVVDMFDKWFQKKPLKDNIVAVVHYGKGMENAFWNGEYVIFGDGNITGTFRSYPWTSLDVIAHEIGHGVTQQNSGLYYFRQSGGINEAFSDMMGIAAEHFLGQTDWEIATEVLQIGSLRYMYDPTKDRISVGHAKDYCPFKDVHHSSGIFNQAFYFLSNTKGWSIKSAFEVFYIANRLYWHENSRFGDAACGVVKAAKDAGMPQADVTAAFKKVGIEPCVDLDIGSYDLSGANDSVVTYRVSLKAGDVVLAVEGRGNLWLSLKNQIGLTLTSIEVNGYTALNINETLADEVGFLTIQGMDGQLFRSALLMSYHTDHVYNVAKKLSNNDTEKHPTVSFLLADDFFQGQVDGNRNMALFIDVLEKEASDVKTNSSSSDEHFSLRTYLSHGHPVSVFSREFDEMGSKLSQTKYVIFVCDAQPGKYHLLMKGLPDSRFVKVYYVHAKLFK